MNSMQIRRTGIAVAAAVLLPFSLAACSDSSSDTKAAPTEAAGASAETSAAPTGDSMTGDKASARPVPVSRRRVRAPLTAWPRTRSPLPPPTILLCPPW